VGEVAMGRGRTLVRLLFVKEALAWPRSSGHDVHCYHMMRAVAASGHDIALATLHRPADEAIRGLPLGRYDCLGDATEVNGDTPAPRLSKLQEKFRSYWGIELPRVRAVGKAARDWGADAVVVVGLNVLPYLGAVEKAKRVWYAADEWAWHHLSLVRPLRPSTWGNLREAVVKGLYERAYGPLLDRVWLVTDVDRRAMRLVAGTTRHDVLPNGVDAEHFAPLQGDQYERSCTFWGRLDFGPNVQGLEWFCRRIWPAVRKAAPDARFTVYGFRPTDAVRSLTGHDGIDLIPDLPDLRAEVARHPVVVLPFISGGGIKNKLLEAAAMGKAVVCSPHACGGLRLAGSSPLRVARSVDDWVRELLALWQNPAERTSLGAAARQWVMEHHTWEAAARTALAGLSEVAGGTVA
jgi:glycosyltransferase involved in cell wall biosynthesis